jgi:4-diphosphocytidyl-2-C-methyl-D-erythritol kinase
VPKIKVSTPFIYKKWDRNLRTFKLTTPKHDVKILTSAVRKKRPSLLAGALFNDLEEVTLRFYPEVLRIRKRLADLGLKAILMSGSGPAVFAIVSSGKEAVSLCRKLKDQHRSWRVFAVRTF